MRELAGCVPSFALKSLRMGKGSLALKLVYCLATIVGSALLPACLAVIAGVVLPSGLELMLAHFWAIMAGSALLPACLAVIAGVVLSSVLGLMPDCASALGPVHCLAVIAGAVLSPAYLVLMAGVVLSSVLGLMPESSPASMLAHCLATMGGTFPLSALDSSCLPTGTNQKCPAVCVHTTDSALPDARCRHATKRVGTLLNGFQPPLKPAPTPAPAGVVVLHCTAGQSTFSSALAYQGEGSQVTTHFWAALTCPIRHRGSCTREYFVPVGGVGHRHATHPRRGGVLPSAARK